MNRNALMAGEDRIFAMPSHSAARNSLGFDRMEVLKQNPQAYRPQPFPTMRGFR